MIYWSKGLQRMSSIWNLKKISELICSKKSDFEIAQIFANVFNDAFGENYNAETYLNIAKEIKCELIGI